MEAVRDPELDAAYFDDLVRTGREIEALRLAAGAPAVPSRRPAGARRARSAR
ncbi:MAG TPA: hypothetical protein VGC30_13505 [Dokdonella sp.]